MEPLAVVLFIVGLGLLVAGAEALVRGTSAIAARAGISPLVIGLTVVAFGTSAPEMAVSVSAAYGGQAGADLALGNVVGSNICNVLLILGICAVITPLAVAQQLVRFDVPLLIGVSLLVLLLSLDGDLGRGSGALLFAGVIGYTAFAVRKGRREGTAVEPEYAGKPQRRLALVINAGLVVLGLALLVLGARWLVDGAIRLARLLGIGELVIGLTVVAVGTSLPEVATSIVASLRGERDIAVGNVIGSCLFNLLAVLGLAALVAPGPLTVQTSMLHFDLPVMVATAVACLPIFFTGYSISRWEGLLFLGYYIAYTAFLVLSATGSDAADPFRGAMLWVVLPLTAITLIIGGLRQLRA